MFDYAQRVQLALTDVARRSAIKIVAGVIILIGACFLLAALWAWLAYELAWGAMMASLAIGAGAVLIGLIVLAVASRPRHEMPSTDDLRREVQVQLNLAADAAVDRVKGEARRVVGMAENKAYAVMDEASYRATKLASDAEERVYGLARNAAETVGLTAENIGAAKQGLREAKGTAKRAADSNAGSMAKLLGAFAMGVALAAKVQDSRNKPRRDFDDDDLI